MNSTRVSQDIKALEKIPPNICHVREVSPRDGGTKSENEPSLVAVFTMYEATDLILNGPLILDVLVCDNYPVQPPRIQVHSQTHTVLPSTLVDGSGFITVEVLSDAQNGWSRSYDLRVAFFSIRAKLRKALDPWVPPSTQPPEMLNLSNLSLIEHPLDRTRLPLRFSLVIGETQGRRPTMEDAHVYIPSAAFRTEVSSSTANGTVAFGICDGHGGAICARSCAQTFPPKLFGELSSGVNVPAAMYNAFLATDREFLSSNDSNSGSTMCMCLYDGDCRLYCANTGDCRAVLCRNGRAYELSRDAKASDPEEIASIAAAGGFVTMNRAMGTLAVSRAMGDKHLKPFISCYPEVVECILQSHDEFILVACDGLYDVLSSQQAVDFVRNYTSNDAKAPGSVAEELVAHAVCTGSLDNVTAIVAYIGRPPTHAEGAYAAPTYGSQSSIKSCEEKSSSTIVEPQPDPRISTRRSIHAEPSDEEFMGMLLDDKNFH